MKRKDIDAEQYAVFLKKMSVEDFKVAELMLKPSRKETRKHLLTAKKLAASLPNPLAE